MRLNLGCGNEKLHGWIGVDCGNCSPDVKWDLEQFPYPFEDNSIETIRMNHVIEHIHKEKIPLLIKEFSRICIKGAKIIINAPYGLSDNFCCDITHVTPITTRTLDFFSPDKPLSENGRIYGYVQCLKILEAKLIENAPYGPDVYILAEII